ncbi:hypothetical protein [Pseudofulvibacter geojedonensis]|uniref:Uncharacterized protein n=1 Tax=Pseudofulvibacter geojedonensis TaxID=1123758 RepID=A0ABW3I5C0_9FLAO
MKKTILFLIIGISFIACQKKPKQTSKLVDFIPNNPSLIINSSSLEELKETINSSELIQQFKNTKSYQKLKSDFSFYKDLNINQEVLISYSTIGKGLDFLLATKSNNNQIKKESTPKLYNKTQYYKLKNHEAFTTTIDSVLIISSSELLIENLIRNQENNITYNNNSLNKLIKTNTNNISVYINNEKPIEFLKPILPTTFISKKGWTSFSVNTDNGININGTVTETTLTDSFLNNLSKSNTQKSIAAKIIPLNNIEYKSFAFEEVENIDTKFENFNELKNNSSEIVSFNDGKQQVSGFLLIDNSIIDNLTELDTYRNITIFQNDHYKIPPFINKPQPQYACLLDNFLLFSSSKEGLQNCIAHYQNKTTLNKQEFYLENISDLLTNSHVTTGKKNQYILNSIANIIDDKSILKVNIDDYPLLSQQVTYEENYINFSSVIKKASPVKNTSGVTQAAIVSLDKPLGSFKQWVTNHKTKQQELLAQDIENNLYLISKKGSILWKKQLDSPIQGNITQVDLYRNRKLQFAFTTENEFMVLDRNGKLVDPFYKKYNNHNLLPLAVFDYDKNRNYRFLISYNNEVNMLDNKMKPVKGFTFKKASSNLTASPKHIRIGTKDYIVITESNGKLNILNRQGKDRTKIKTTFDFNNTTITPIKNSLIFRDTKNTIYKVNIATGKTEKVDLLKGTITHFTQNDNLKVKLEDQNLSIKNNTVELEYGNYTAPEIFYQNKKYYISTTDLDSQKTYLFDSNGKSFAKFPVYGKSNITLKKNLFAVQGEGNNVLIYQL